MQVSVFGRGELSVRHFGTRCYEKQIFGLGGSKNLVASLFFSEFLPYRCDFSGIYLRLGLFLTSRKRQVPASRLLSVRVRLICFHRRTTAARFFCTGAVESNKLLLAFDSVWIYWVCWFQRTKSGFVRIPFFAASFRM